MAWDIFIKCPKLFLDLPEFKNKCRRVSHSKTSITPTSDYPDAEISHYLTWLAPYFSQQIPDSEGTTLTHPLNPKPQLKPLS